MYEIVATISEQLTNYIHYNILYNTLKQIRCYETKKFLHKTFIKKKEILLE